MPLIPETKMVDGGKLINLGNLLVREVTWLVLTTTSATLILSLEFGAFKLPYFVLTCHDKDCLYILSSSKNSLSYTMTYRDRTDSLSYICLPDVNLTKMYTFCNPFLSSSAISVRLFPTSNTASEISSNPEREKQPTWEKTHAFSHTLLYFYISIPYMKYLVHIHFIVYWTLSKFSLFP